MRKLLIAVGSSLLFAPFAAANANTQMIQGLIDHARRTIATDCADEATLSCMEINANQCIKIKEGILEKCTIPVLKDLKEISESSVAKMEAENAQCAVDYVTKKHNIDLQQFVTCVGEDSFDPETLETLEEN